MNGLMGGISAFMLICYAVIFINSLNRRAGKKLGGNATLPEKSWCIRTGNFS